MVNNDVCGHEWGDSPIIFTSDAVTSENYWRITSRVTTNIVINGSTYIILFLTLFSSTETQINRWKLPSIDRSSIVVVLWRHANIYLWSIVVRIFPSGSRASFHCREVDYHSLIIDNFSRRFHWLACKKIEDISDNGTVPICQCREILVIGYSGEHFIWEHPWSSIT